ncbi:hypothetical protein Goshw_007537 [Gossypium schwendimanii]|uniref:Uncharacterized protein n=1 Tax=Gossypium schwendimanii TaxID=34291 RepID=A0A7J9L8L0_GOSSC|nr:hypothetical protein [Gossypium schwendimanii]
MILQTVVLVINLIKKKLQQIRI